MDLTNVGGLLSGVTGLLFLLLAIGTFLSRRMSREARATRDLRNEHVDALTWIYSARKKAAREGYKLDPLPKSLTAAADKDEADDEVQLLKKFQDLVKGGDNE